MTWKQEIIIQEIEVYELENMNLIFLKAFIKKIIGGSLMIDHGPSETSKENIIRWDLILSVCARFC